MAHNQLTIVSVHGHTDGSSTLPSIIRSMRELPGSKGLLISPAKPHNIPDNIEWKRCFPFDYRGYSTFIMHCLYEFVETDFCLIVQDDGWVLDGNNWRDEYYDYDYIGGITHAGLVRKTLYLGFEWTEHEDPILVMNGGFSLRSRRLLEAPNKLGIVQTYSEEIHLWNEDIQLSCIKRPIFESIGLKYAPNEVAKYFSMEHIAPKFHDDMDFTKLFGHHSTSRKLIRDNEIILPVGVKDAYRETEFLSFLQSKGYILNYVPNGTYQA